MRDRSTTRDGEASPASSEGRRAGRRLTETGPGGDGPRLEPATRKAVVAELADARARSDQDASYVVLYDHAVNRDGLRRMSDSELVAEFEERLGGREPRARRRLLAAAKLQLSGRRPFRSRAGAPR